MISSRFGLNPTIIQTEEQLSPCQSSALQPFIVMVTVAVAGGAGGLGKTVVEPLQPKGSKHKTFIFGRKV